MAYGKSQLHKRREDKRLVTGRGNYVDDISLPRMAHAAMVYSDVAHGHLLSIDVAKAAQCDGVIAILTGSDCAQDGIKGIRPRYLPQMFGFGEALPIERPALVTDKVRHVGDRVAMVIAETRAQAEAAAAEVIVHVDPLPAAISLQAAIDGVGAPVHEARPNNMAYDLTMGDVDACEKAFAQAHSTHSITYEHPRMTANSMETRGGVGVYDDVEDLYTLHTTTQNPHVVRTELANMALGIKESQLRVLTDDVGGGFGMKTSTFPEDSLVLWAAKRVGRPVKWICNRRDSLRTDEHGRGSQGKVEIALDEDAKILAMRSYFQQDVGAYMVGAGPMPLIHTARLVPGVYNVPIVDVRGAAYYTNLPTTVPFRGAGRPEGIFGIEQALDKAARDLGISPVDIRRRNFIQPDQMPHQTKVNFTYDTGEFEALMDSCIEKSDWAGFEARKAADAEQGLLRGRGIGLYIHDTGSMNDQAEVSFNPSGTVTVVSGTTDTGQGHKTTFANQVAGRLGIDPANIRVIQGDTEKVSFGRGSFASRSTTMVGSAIELACDQIIEKGKFFAAMEFEVDVETVTFDTETGVFSDRNSNKSMTISEVANLSYRPYVPITDRIGLSAVGAFKQISPSFPNGCHVAEVVIDPETGETKIDRYTVVDDLGNMLNPMICEGQIHGAIANGFGESFIEQIVSDAETGDMISRNFGTYAMPRATDLPNIDADFRPVPCTTNPGGFKGAGEGGTVGSISTLKHAVLDAMSPYGVSDIAKPMTPERIWATLQNSKGH
ncbi:xanthine dehydrogenase family protein molybdopterin-binding subunit [Cognatishimia sp. SS12]|uniref:xanthine dehydrogenase family protein molybdopterin-binding subunit n=1 Tax=Cognatishimia sp. SS12 TaxID=2979465 RepID=UPI00232D336B|nr:xanthine dehydrogenase family protein molybdopterin-binding subunit [Cognatishimia sp. SS12]MDC0738063.1 xanthine dehydrogenase family protein molybdopterin-binding subunit [Cognatishimia sp. SS12]